MFTTGSMIKNRNMNNIEDVIKQVQKLYLQSGFKITRIHADSEFEPLRAKMADLSTPMNLTSKKEHVPEIYLLKRTVNECVQSIREVMPLKQISKLRIVHLFASAIFWLNDYPQSKHGAGLYNTKGPGKPVLVTVTEYKNVFCLHPGKHIKLHQEY